LNPGPSASSGSSGDSPPPTRVPDIPPDFTVLPPAPPDVVPPTRSRGRRIGRWLAMGFGAWFAVGLAASAISALYGDDDTSVDPISGPATSVRGLDRPATSHLCPAPGAGWTLVIGWERPTSEVAWSPDGGASWRPMAAIDAQSWRREEIAPSQVTLVRIRYQGDSGPAEGLLSERSPDSPC
jgi:hypothetical protein